MTPELSDAILAGVILAVGAAVVTQTLKIVARRRRVTARDGIGWQLGFLLIPVAAGGLGGFAFWPWPWGPGIGLVAGFLSATVVAAAKQWIRGLADRPRKR